MALHTAPEGFFKTGKQHSNHELCEFVRKAASLGFQAVQIGPLHEFAHIEGEFLRGVLDSLDMASTIHVGGSYEAREFAATGDGAAAMRKQIEYGIEVCREAGSDTVSIHPPFFSTTSELNRKLLPEARERFLRMLWSETSLASHNHIRMALESFCYPPFIFEGLQDFVHFVSEFPEEKLGVLLDAGHLYQMGIDPSDAASMLGHRLLDVHVHDAKMESNYRKATHLPIGKGTVNFPRFVANLIRCGYDGHLTLEVRGSESDIVGSKSYLENLLGST